MEGYIKIHRKFMDWEWWDNDKLVKLFLYLLFKANFTDKKWHGIVIKRGSFITGLESIAKDVKYPKSTVARLLDKLKSTGEISTKAERFYTAITVCNYDDYQDVNLESGKQTGNKWETSGKQTVTTKEVKNDKERKENILFDRFWNLYEKKTGIHKSKIAWNKLTIETMETIIKSVPAYRKANSRENYRYLPNPLTFLNGQNWKDVSEVTAIDEDKVDVIEYNQPSQRTRVSREVLEMNPKRYTLYDEAIHGK